MLWVLSLNEYNEIDSVRSLNRPKDCSSLEGKILSGTCAEGIEHTDFNHNLVPTHSYRYTFNTETKGFEMVSKERGAELEPHLTEEELTEIYNGT